MSLSGATHSSYTLASADVGHTMRAVVTAANGTGSTAATSPQSGAVAPAAPSNTALPVVSGSDVQGQTLSTTNGSWTGSPTYAYVWADCDSSGNACTNISGANGSTYTLVGSDVGHTVRAIVSATNVTGVAQASSAQSAVVTAAAAPTASFTHTPANPTTGQSVHFDASGSKCPAGSCTYAWTDQTPTGGSWLLGSGQTIDFTFTGTGTKYVTLTVTDALNQSNVIEHDLSVADGTIAAPTNMALPTLAGTPQSGSTLTESDGTGSGNPTSITYQWQLCDAFGANCSNDSSATAKTYALDAGDIGQTVRSVATATNAGGSTSATTAATSVVTAAPVAVPVNTSLPTISGTPTQGQVLTAANGSWSESPTSYTYQWRHCDSSGSNCTDISGAGSGTYTLASGDVGNTIRVVVTAKNAAGTTNGSSSQTSVVAAQAPAPPSNTAAPVISGTAAQGQVLTTSSGSWNGSPTGYTYQWQRCSASCANISGASASAYTVVSADVGDTIDGVVTATNAGGSTSKTSAMTATVSSGQTGGQPTKCAGTPGSRQPNDASLDACGYPSPNTTGVPAGTTLTPVASASLPAGVTWSGGQLTFNGSNVAVSGLLIQGIVRFNGTNDTLQNSKVVAGGGADLVYLAGTSGNTIKNSTIQGIDATTNANFCGRAIHMAGSVPVIVSRVYINNCADGVVGVSRTTDSYIMVNVTYCGSACSHDEPIYIPGGGGPNASQTLIQHNTLFNTQGQTSAIFGDDHAWGPLTNVTVDNNILEGGDYALELGNPGDGDTGIVVTNNRFSRIFWSLGGAYGSLAGPGGSNPVWSGNVWDDTLQVVNPA